MSNAFPGHRAARSEPDRRRVWLAVAVAACLVAIGGAAYAVLAHRSHATSAQGSHSPPSATSRSPGASVTHAGDLRRYLVAVPNGSSAWPKPLGTKRTLSLRQVANLSTNSRARRAMLARDHFARGAVQSWITKSGTWVDVRLYQFGSAADAQRFFRSDVAASARETPASDQSGVSQVPGARAFAAPKPNRDGYIAVIAIGVKGDVTFLVDIAEHSRTARLGMPDRLLQAQYQKL